MTHRLTAFESAAEEGRRARRAAADGSHEARPATMEENRRAFAAPADAIDAWPLLLRNVTRRWHKRAVPVLDDLSLALEPRELTWVGGENGAGKTTMLRVAAGLIQPDAGLVSVWGHAPSSDRMRYQRLVSFLPAGDRGLYARLSVRRQLELCGRLAMLPRDRFGELVELALQRFELDQLADRRVDRMSMGQRQRLRIAMTFLPCPEIVLLDEPLTSLDSRGAELLRAAVADTLARDGAVLWCSPSGEGQGTDFDRRWVLDEGRLSPA